MNSPLPPPGLEPTLYFFSNSLTVIAIAGLVYFVLGLWFGYLTWGRFKRRARAFQEETNLLRLEIAKLKRRIAEDVVAPAPIVAPAPLLGLTPEPEMIVLDQGATASDASAIVEPVAAPEPPSTPEAEAPKETLAAIVGVTPIIPAIPEQAVAPVVDASTPEPVVEPAHQPAKPEPATPVVPEAPPEIVPPSVPVEPEPAPGPVLAVAIAEPTPADAVTSVPTPVLAKAPTPESPAVESTPVPLALPLPAPAKTEDAPPSAPTDLAARLFADELKAGTVRFDGRLGIVYGDRPDRWDDLTLMRGVAELTQQRLHDFGIYTFKQIAAWDDRVTREVGLAIHAKDRIGRERWSQQARDLHYLKYGEKIA